MKKSIFLMPLLIAVALLFTGCHSQDSNEQKAVTILDGKTMGTYWQVSIADSVQHPEQIHLALEKVLQEVNHQMSTFQPDSEISLFNKYKDKKPHKISPEFMKNIVAAQEISEKSNGVYDITVEPLVDLWGFGPDKIKQAPTQAEIDAALKKVGYRQLHVDQIAGTIAKANPEMKIGLSSIAKGYGVDAVSAQLDKMGYPNYLVDIGGELLAKGNKYGELWRVAIEQPVDGRHIQQVMPLELKNNEQIAMATSGNYRNFIDYDGKRAVHTIDPRTGYSAQSRLLSVTVVAPNCMYADGYATALMALGEKGAEGFARSQNLPVLFIFAGDDPNKKDFIVKRSPMWLKKFGA